MRNRHLCWSGSRARGGSPTFRLRLLEGGRRYYSYLTNGFTHTRLTHIVNATTSFDSWGHLGVLPSGAAKREMTEETSSPVGLSIMMSKNMITDRQSSSYVSFSHIHVGSPHRAKRTNSPMGRSTWLGRRGCQTERMTLALATARKRIQSLKPHSRSRQLWKSRVLQERLSSR